MSQNENNQVIQHTEHTGPHIPAIQGEKVVGYISNTAITTIIFALLVLFFSLFANYLLKKNKNSKIKIAVLNYLKLFDDYLRDSFLDKTVARKYFPLVVGIFSIIFFGNIFGLAIDWSISAFPNIDIEKYLRPMHSDLNTTLVLATITVFSFLVVGLKTHGVGHTVKGYLFNFKGNSFGEKCVNVFVGWLHLIGIPATLTSLSLRLFGNIFAGIVLISVITYLGSEMTQNLFQTGRFLSIPFWFFEFFVAFIQSVVFAALIVAYINQAKEEH